MNNTVWLLVATLAWEGFTARVSPSDDLFFESNRECTAAVEEAKNKNNGQLPPFVASLKCERKELVLRPVR